MPGQCCTLRRWQGCWLLPAPDPAAAAAAAAAAAGCEQEGAAVARSIHLAGVQQGGVAAQGMVHCWCSGQCERWVAVYEHVGVLLGHEPVSASSTCTVKGGAAWVPTSQGHTSHTCVLQRSVYCILWLVSHTVLQGTAELLCCWGALPAMPACELLQGPPHASCRNPLVALAVLARAATNHGPDVCLQVAACV
jgi:hypothetical protein